MKRSEFLGSGLMDRKARLNEDIDLTNGVSREKGDVVSVIKDYGDGYYLIEDNDFACKAHEEQIEFIS